MPPEGLAKGGVIGHCAHVSEHFTLVACDEVVFARTKKTLAVLPGGGNQRNPAGKRFEDPDRRDSRQEIHVEPPRNMDGCEMLRKDLRRTRVRQPSAVLRTV